MLLTEEQDGELVSNRQEEHRHRYSRSCAEGIITGAGDPHHKVMY